MNSGIVADGNARLLVNPQMQSRLHALYEAISRRHAAEWADAGFFRRFLIRRRIASEFNRQRAAIVPSRESLF